MVIAGGSPLFRVGALRRRRFNGAGDGDRRRAREAGDEVLSDLCASTEPAMVIAGGRHDRWEVIARHLSLQRSRRW